jgi:hypothetical protein
MIDEVFYKHIIDEATIGRIDCLNYYNIAFETDVMGEKYFYVGNRDGLIIPTLMIRNKEYFDELLMEYVELAKEFYGVDSFDKDVVAIKWNEDEKARGIEKTCMSLLWANATIEDFNDPISFLRRRINFIRNDFVDKRALGYSLVMKADIEIEILKDKITNEGPYQFVVRLINESQSVVELPSIKFGIDEDKVYIYAIQNSKNNTDSAFMKWVNRRLYKVGIGYDSSLDDDESLQDITASFLYVLSIGVGYFSSIGIDNIIVPSILIERWNNKKIANKRKLERGKINQEEFDEKEGKQDYLQSNLTNKLIRTFLRLGCHFNNIEVDSFPFEVDSSLRIKIHDGEVIGNNYLLMEGYNLGTMKRDKNTR